MAERIQAVVFDAYGTLFDVHSVVDRCEQLFPGHGEALSRLWRSKQLEYTWLRSLMGRYEAFESVTQAALTHCCASLGLHLDSAGSRLLLEEYRHLATYPDVQGVLQSLHDVKLAILSNGSPQMLQALVRNAGLEPLLNAVLSVDPLSIFKPHPSVYQLAVDTLAVQAGSIAFVSSNYWDACGATSFGFRTYWVNRGGVQPDELGYRPHRTLERLDQLPAALAAS
ncbi:MAG TPA: haloacid dehalogenase type II [Burkholderiales bacterium]|nr:haloacid dehalogenase type II [Burkholderiales bacterium]